MVDWQRAQEWERTWWGNCANTYGEEEKQLLYAEKMGLRRLSTPETVYNFDALGMKILDIGSGPCSLLLKCLNLRKGYALDPLMDVWPDWVQRRYKAAGIFTLKMKAEDLRDAPKVDEVWLYNVLEHTENPQLVVSNAQRLSQLIRLFEWIDTTPNEGHPNAFTEAILNEWLHGEGRIEQFARGRAVGRGYYGVFPC